jgi:hypothetical protein
MPVDCSESIADRLANNQIAAKSGSVQKSLIGHFSDVQGSPDDVRSLLAVADEVIEQ